MLNVTERNALNHEYAALFSPSAQLLWASQLWTGGDPNTLHSIRGEGWMEFMSELDQAKMKHFLSLPYEADCEISGTIPETGELREIFAHKINLRGNWLVATKVGEIIWDPNATLEGILRESD